MTRLEQTVLSNRRSERLFARRVIFLRRGWGICTSMPAGVEADSSRGGLSVFVDLPGVIGRVCAATIHRWHLSTDRLNDAQRQSAAFSHALRSIFESCAVVAEPQAGQKTYF